MAFIEPMHRNKPNITYLLTEWCMPSSTPPDPVIVPPSVGRVIMR